MLDIYSTLKHLKLFVDIVNAHLVMKFNVEGGKRKKKSFSLANFVFLSNRQTIIIFNAN